MDFVKGSQLLYGTHWVYTRRVEWQNYPASMEDILKSSQEFCHLCTIFWQSIPEDRKRPNERAGTKPRVESNVLETGCSIPCPTDGPKALEEGRNRNNQRLRVKIWEELGGGHRAWHEKGHPIYMQLHRDQNVLGRRIQLQEGNTFRYQ
jgi:hypothetical protein